MVPVLEDLYRELRDSSNQPLVGVRALFLYPLNALINSQRERLDAWTSGFGSGIRYCLYNGNTEELHASVKANRQTSLMKFYHVKNARRASTNTSNKWYHAGIHDGSSG